MRYRIEFDDGNFSLLRYVENRDRSVLHACRTFVARNGGNEPPVDAVVPDDQNRVVRANGQEAFDEA